MVVQLSNGQQATFTRYFNSETLAEYEKNVEIPHANIAEVLELNIEDKPAFKCK